MKIEMPELGDRLWINAPERDGFIEWRRVGDLWYTDGSIEDGLADYEMLRFAPLYTTHPYAELLAKYPAPWTVGPSGTIRSHGHRVVLDPTLQCPPCLTGFFAYLVNEFAARNATSDTGGEKR